MIVINTIMMFGLDLLRLERYLWPFDLNNNRISKYVTIDNAMAMNSGFCIEFGMFMANYDSVFTFNEAQPLPYLDIGPGTASESRAFH